MRHDGVDVDGQQALIKAQLPVAYDEMKQALMLDIAEQVSSISSSIGGSGE